MGPILGLLRITSMKCESRCFHGCVVEGSILQRYEPRQPVSSVPKEHNVVFT